MRNVFNSTRLSMTVIPIVLSSYNVSMAQGPERASPNIRIGSFPQEVADVFTLEHGLPANDVMRIAVTADGSVYAATANGLARFDWGVWLPHQLPVEGPITDIVPFGDNSLLCLVKGEVFRVNDSGTDRMGAIPARFREQAGQGRLFVMGNEAVVAIPGQGLVQITRSVAPGWPRRSPRADVRTVTDFASGPSGQMALASPEGVFVFEAGEGWRPVYPSDGKRAWALPGARGVAFDPSGRLWFAAPQGVGVLGEVWTLYEGRDGLPYNDFTGIAPAPDGSIWFGTTRGAIHFDGEHWAYRQGRRWLPHDEVRAVAVAPNGDAWFATPGGVGRIRRVPMTLREKAAFYEDEIDQYHRRTPYEYVLEVHLPEAGKKENVVQHDSDNDGLWTAMYGAGECFAYAATRDPKAKARAAKAFQALRFLGEVTQGGTHLAPKGFVARTILPTSGPDPNEGRLERDRREQAEGDALWKVIDPRWPVSADGQWYWKCDTSSDELDGHYFFYAQYYDLVAETEAEKRAVREHVKALTDHLIAHGFNLVDHDGKPTRWARYSPEELNFDPNWFVERGLNSLSMLSYLAVTAHVTGNERYNRIARDLITRHGYAQNLMYPKFQRGIGTGNQSDDEMAFMCYYNLLKYERDPELRGRYALSWWHYWRLEQPELNPFFNFAFAGQCLGATFRDAWGLHQIGPTGDWLEESVDTLKRFPLDRIDWRHTNSHRIDIMPLPGWTRAFDEGEPRGRGVRVNGKVLPVDERHFNHWNTDPFRLDQGGDGRGLADGTVFLLPYYMGLYHGFIVEE